MVTRPVSREPVAAEVPEVMGTCAVGDVTAATADASGVGDSAKVGEAAAVGVATSVGDDSGVGGSVAGASVRVGARATLQNCAAKSSLEAEYRVDTVPEMFVSWTLPSGQA
jgi:hypothetical protein